MIRGNEIVNKMILHLLKKLLQIWCEYNIVNSMKFWDIDKLLVKYPIKNIWEWKYTDKVITSRVRLNDIEKDPWNRAFTTTSWTIDEMGMLVYGSVDVEKKSVRLWSCV
jgi:hypothetical protein